jgi:hypothetical protein
MRTSLFAVLVAVVAGTSAVSGPAPTSPVVLNDCFFSAFVRTARNGDPNITALRELQVNFRNAGSATITAVTFDAVKDGEHIVVTDKGRFTNGATINHQLLAYATAWTGGSWDNFCKVTAAQFADGSTSASN